MIVFVQCFPMSSAGGGGARILRRLTEERADRVRFVCTAPNRPGALLENEAWIPIRPPMGRIDNSRFRGVADLLELPARPSFRGRIRKFLLEVGASAVHVLPHHNSDFFVTSSVARSLGLRVICSIHDDFRYVNRNHPRIASFERELEDVWTTSDFRFCIGREIGEEYGRRYGAESFDVVTDGVDSSDIRTAGEIGSAIRPYFMGLFHNGYRENLSSFLDGLQLIRESGRVQVGAILLRCGSLTGFNYCRPEDFEVLPFESQHIVTEDINRSDLLYLPLPFGAAYEGFVKYSFSTKLISYLCSGKLIIYHGPRDTALANYLERRQCAVMIYSLVKENIAQQLSLILKDELSTANLLGNGIKAARSDFDIGQIRERFWNKFSENEY